MAMELQRPQSSRSDGRHNSMGNTDQVANGGERVSPNPFDLPSPSSSSCNSSRPNSPDHEYSASASSPSLSPNSMQADPQSCILDISAAPAGSSARRPRYSIAEAMESLQESIPHAMKLQQLHKSEKGFQKDASDHKKAVRRLSKELYMIVSMYALMQGALFAAVAQTSVFTCDDWWGPTGIAGAVTLGTLRGALEKLWRMGKQKKEVEKFQRRQSAVYDKIETLRFEGSACSMENLEPEHNDIFESGRGFVFSPHGLLVLGFLVGFSGLIIISCNHMLCRHCHCTPP